MLGSGEGKRRCGEVCRVGVEKVGGGCGKVCRGVIEGVWEVWSAWEELWGSVGRGVGMCCGVCER